MKTQFLPKTARRMAWTAPIFLILWVLIVRLPVAETAQIPPASCVKITGSQGFLFQPQGVAVGRSGDIYIADTSNHTIRQLTSTGEMTTVAGLAGSPGSTDGIGSVVRFNFPESLAVDGSGNFYVSDRNNNTIRRVTPAGVVTTVAGFAGCSGSADGIGSAARFRNPRGLTVDGAGNIYVADRGNSTIRVITPAGVVRTLAGLAGHHGSEDGMGSAARFNSPQGVAVGGTGEIYVADRGNNTIRVVTPAGLVKTLAGLAGCPGNEDGSGTAARFIFPASLAADKAGRIYVVDQYGSTIRGLTPAGVVTTLAGLAGSSGFKDGTGNAARFDCPIGMAVDSAGNIYVADAFNSAIRRVTPGGVVTTLTTTTRQLAGN